MQRNLPRFIPYRESPRWSAIGLCLSLTLVWPALQINLGAGLFMSAAAAYCLLLVLRSWRCAHIVIDAESITVPTGFLQSQQHRIPFSAISKVEKYFEHMESEADGARFSQYVLRIETADGLVVVKSSLLPDQDTLDEIETFLHSRCPQ